MRITFAASEGVPYSKTGGLADVAGALPRALARLGHEVSVFLPLYRVSKPRIKQWKVAIESLTIPFADQHRFSRIIDDGRDEHGVQHYFVDYDPYFDREALYNTQWGDYGDNLERYTLFCRAVLEASKLLGVPDVFHAHDWQTALVPVLLRTLYYDDHTLAPAASVFTIHNMGYQGIFPGGKLATIVVPQWLYSADRLEHFGSLNLLKGGILYGDHVTTVSPTYMQEIHTPEFAFGLDGPIRARGADCSGILNGVDYHDWNPETDKYIAAHYSAEDLAGKRECKLDLLRAFHLPEDAETPLIGIVSRFATQKGFDLIAGAAAQLVREKVRMVVLGTGERQYEDLFRAFASHAPDRFAVRVAYDNALAHKIEAGADMFLMPSHYEPCGLNQIYSLKYGTPPIVRATGGLEDTVENWNPNGDRGTGFKFTEYTPHALIETVRWALRTFQFKESWKKLMVNGMERDFSWERSAEQYVGVYEHVRGQRRYLVGR
ncbi:MAG: glycogen synthase GlgA [Acidobacteriales bacterium]|nr:glycogen synthase GlgA [Terriglobales bacterium]